VPRKQPGSKPDEVLRARAEKFLAQTGPDPGTPSPTDVQKLVYDLQLRQIELDMQNEELRRSQGETAAACAKYADLYDFAPIGYFTFDPQGIILEANLTGARLLGVEPGFLLHTPFVSHVAPAFRSEFIAHLGQVFATRARQFCTLELATPEGAPRHVALESIAVQTEAGGPSQCRSAVSDITARQLAEAAWHRSEEKFFLLFDKAPLGYQSLDEEGRILEVNQTWLDLMGYSREEVQGRWFKDFLTRDHQDLFAECFTRFKAAGKANGVEWHMIRKDGTIIIASFNGKVIRDEHSRLLSTHCLFEDITARKRGEETLKASEASYRAIFDSANDAIFIHDGVTGAILDVNGKMEEMYGYTPAEAGNLSVAEISSGQAPYTQENALTRIRQAAAGEPQLFEWLCKDKNGRLFWVEVSLKRAVIGGQDRVLAIVRDINARKHGEEELKTTVASLENIIASSVDPIAIVDAHGRFTRWNQAAEQAYGFNAQDLATKTAFEFYADKAALETMLSQLRRDGFVQGYEIDMQQKDGVIAPFCLSIRLLRDENGKSTGSVCVARNLSKTRKSLAAMEQMNAQLHALVQESERRNRDLTLINCMAEKLQSCLSLDEAYPLIAQHAQSLFPARSGALFIQNPTNNLLEAVSTWGDAPVGKLAFPPTDCWALRRGRENLGGGHRPEMRCRHLPPLQPDNYLCLPLLVHRETLGLLHIQDLSDMTPERAEPLKTLAVTIGDHISLALANIRLRETLHHQVIHDALTGLFNRRYLEETLEREIHRVRRKGASLGLIMLDLDHFKHFNDTYGHEAGDNLLRTLGKFLADRIRQEDVACRYGGEEFVLILAEASQEIVQQRAEEIRREFPKLQVMHRGQMLESVTVSLGIAMFPDHGATGRDVLRAADHAMYRAKAQGRNQVVVAETRVPGPR
jgi:diguanylate cyclase (GGDEF)-like protein/PAS domain S-box-containing protein